ncbi:MAG: ATP-dependent DNA helicase RecG [Candidatus Brocadia sp. AMX2]|uniref:ATP-dependent DNA helicase RecG n=1 Tax=Candidatus Brocadia sinica JPN1 TaxID=1197129 RepID=A0ABQ0K003_9BACT|nr:MULTISPECIES: ATP-dependent DNA helicase RecG [Brocadia]MBC6931711.1 ATP-dependent DNA helicase RecG [Candidatus Brocadia sp.]MBL1169346.1 ATP-dependent DNA helicase RecG [Candidatus Brocadia sp. AMX1]NOG42197.1 ATP-dependent DNA helicase RecG [Planctomycetota bacterium]GIK11410.1 MAG: ATP-dependent DNA helicase RecG [Candidatus Brocadia sinica]KAA0242257.1 MAG: ATP-dependent DNA helicase RecG [Candidatus Brocadia sp. AMX2]
MVVTKSLAKTASQSALNQSVQFLKGVGPKRSEIFTKLGIDTIRDVLFYFPRDYKDRTRIQRISEAKIGAEITIQGRVLGIQTRMARSRKSILEIFVGDGTGAIAATWFNQPFLANKFHVGDMVFLHGKVGAYKYLQLLGPEYEVIRENEIDVKEGSVVPVYSLTEHMSQTHFRKIMKMAVHQFAGHIEEILPKEITKKNQLVSINDAVRNIHFPGTFENLEHARCRLIYEELFILELAMALRRRGIKEETGISFKIGANVDTHIRNLIPFALTNAQERVINEITEDMRSSKPMNRLLQGDVGSGKTVVAIYAILAAIANGYQVAFMTPTEILAKQHFQTIQKYLEHSHVRIQLLTGDTNSRQKKDNLDQIKTGQIDLIIGTHALIEETVQFRQLGLVVIDEQHKFGVVQRLKLKKKGLRPDVLIMTATPIPRTLSLTLFGDLDISMLDEMPPGRSPVRTIWVTQDKEKNAYGFIKGEIAKGRQVFIVYPLVEESESFDLKSAVTEARRLQADVFPTLRVGLLHGQMKQAEKDKVMMDFKEKRYDILVSTVIIEVGIDIPNATVMVIVHAERFGLSQLHQLRGRIGRGNEQSYCLLFGNPNSNVSAERLKIMTRTHDGFKIAEMDFRLRGPGEFFGTRQHGLPELKISDLMKDFSILKKARDDAFELVSEDPQLTMVTHLKIRQKVLETFKDRLELINV